jgi:hypothetical protein
MATKTEMKEALDFAIKEDLKSLNIFDRLDEKQATTLRRYIKECDKKVKSGAGILSCVDEKIAGNIIFLGTSGWDRVKSKVEEMT